MTAKTTKAAPRKKAPPKRAKPKPRKVLTAGRPEFVPTTDERQKVEVLSAARMPHEDIARVLGLTPPTLRKHFRQELATGLAKKRAEAIVAMYNAAIGGNVSAQKSFVAMTGVGNTPNPPKDKPAPGAAVAPKMGKKEMQQVAAQTAGQGTDWDGLLN